MIFYIFFHGTREVKPFILLPLIVALIFGIFSYNQNDFYNTHYEEYMEKSEYYSGKAGQAGSIYDKYKSSNDSAEAYVAGQASNTHDDLKDTADSYKNELQKARKKTFIYGGISCYFVIMTIVCMIGWIFDKNKQVKSVAVVEQTQEGRPVIVKKEPKSKVAITIMVIGIILIIYGIYGHVALWLKNQGFGFNLVAIFALIIGIILIIAHKKIKS